MDYFKLWVYSNIGEIIISFLFIILFIILIVLKNER